MSTPPLPTVFLPHGGGPMTYVEMGLPAAEINAIAAHWRAVGQETHPRPTAILVISAHWETPVPTVMTTTQPPMHYDYFGFPPAAYQIQWPAPGAPELAREVRRLLGAAGVDTAEDAERGFDHGTFIPLGRAFPNADIPTTQLSLQVSLDPEAHLAVGRALAPLRRQGVLLVGSGMSYHNMRAFGTPGANADADRFDAWLQETAQLPMAAREARLAAWSQAPSARQAHPREEHLIPLMVVAGAAGQDSGRVTYRGHLFGKRVCGLQFGGRPPSG